MNTIYRPFTTNFSNCYMTSGIQNTVPVNVVNFMLNAVAHMSGNRDYLQVFHLWNEGGKQYLEHTQEANDEFETEDYSREYVVKSETEINQKVYIIDSGDEITVMLAEEY